MFSSIHGSKKTCIKKLNLLFLQADCNVHSNNLVQRDIELGVKENHLNIRMRKRLEGTSLGFTTIFMNLQSSTGNLIFSMCKFLSSQQVVVGLTDSTYPIGYMQNLFESVTAEQTKPSIFFKYLGCVNNF